MKDTDIPGTDTGAPYSIRLRAPEPSDLDVLYRWENDATQWHNSLTAPLTSRHALWRYIDGYSGDLTADGNLRMMIEADADSTAACAVGTIDLCDYDQRNRTAWISIYVDRQYRGRGIGCAALRQALTLAADACGIRMAGALVSTDNHASQALFTTAGFICTGSLPGWILTEQGQKSTDLKIFCRKL